MKLSWIRIFQWTGILAVLVFVAALRYEAPSEAGMQMNAPPESPLSQSLRGYWKMDEGTGTGTTADSSGSGNTLSMSGSPTWTTGTIGPYALDFSGVAESGGITYLGYTEVSDSDGNQSQSVTVPANTDFALAFISGWRSGTNPSVSSISLGGTAMTSVGSSVSDADGAAYMYYVNTTSGSKTFASTQSNSWTEGGKAVLLYFSGVDQSSPIRSSSAQNASGTTTLSFSGMTSQTGDMAVLQIEGYSSVNVDVDLSGQTKIFENAVAFNSEYNAAAYKTATGTTIDLSGSGNYPNGVVAVLKPASYTPAQYLFATSPSSALDFADGASFTITGWFNRDTFAADHTILSSKSAQTTSDGYIIWIDNNAGNDYLMFRADENGSTDAYTFTSSTNFSSTGWHHFAVSWNESAPNAVLYIDGNAEGSASGTAFASMGDLSNTNPFSVGAETDGDLPFDGKLDDIRIYGYALSADQVKKIYQTTAPTQPVDTSLVGHWTFDGTDIQGTTAIDRSSFGNNGTITGATKTIGKLGQALSFNGGSDEIGTAGPSLTTTYTLSLWIYPTAGNVGSYHGLIMEYYIGLYYIRDTSPLCNYINAVDLDDTSERCNNTHLGDNQWHHIVVVNSAGAVTFYLNGTPDGTATGGMAFDVGSIGSGFGGYFAGKIDDVRVYNRALSATEVADLYNMGK